MTTAFPPTGKVRLKTNLADNPVVRALKAGEVRSDLVEFDFCGPKPANKGFKPMIREGAYDAGELAIGSFLQAKVYGKPLVLLPAVVMARFQHHTIVYNASKGELGPKDLEGRRIAVRAYSQTTGIWVRGILKHEHGVDLSRLGWVCTDDAHLAEYRDPANVERPGPGAKPLDRMLIDGDVDAAIPAADLTKDHPHIRHLFPNPNVEGKAWALKYGTVPANHYFVVSKALADARPDVVREIYRLLLESKQLTPPTTDGIDFFPMGVEANRKALELVVQYSVEQEIIPRPFTVGELFKGVASALDRT
ncbi:MAG TPA: phosphate ABC transporter substrate-binding protein [Hyphomicrobiaceae bacterium]|jgi:4,5-dihydroxyphthalate decarboxylase|nr:phosphate ABC transporter substrate-binding protein [Hyphomicrobiaceae bacterium]